MLFVQRLGASTVDRLGRFRKIYALRVRTPADAWFVPEKEQDKFAQ